MTFPVSTTLEYTLTIPQGADWPGINFPILAADNTPYDLTGCSALAQIRPLPASSELFFTWSTSPTTGQGLITLNTSASTLNIRVLATESAPWTFCRGFYDILLTNPAAPIGLQVSRVAMGAVNVSQDVTT